MAEKQRSVITVTIKGIPVHAGAPALADAVVTVDFVYIAAALTQKAVYRKRKKSTLIGGAIIVQATNLRPRTPTRRESEVAELADVIRHQIHSASATTQGDSDA